MIIDGLFQQANAVGLGRNHGYHRTAKALGQGGDIDLNILALGNILHVQGHDARNTQLQQLQRQVEVAFQVGGIDHVDQHIRITAQDVMTGDLLIQRGLFGDGGE
ncbi:hypothetical protein D3C79_370640 [compost metagenome]